jgi:tetratricopeptide (TPR) repeat protein
MPDSGLGVQALHLGVSSIVVQQREPVEGFVLVNCIEQLLDGDGQLTLEQVNSQLAPVTSHAEIAYRCSDVFADLPMGSVNLRRRLHAWAAELLTPRVVAGSVDEMVLLPWLARHLEGAGNPVAAHQRWCEMLSILAAEGRGEQWTLLHERAGECWEIWCGLQGASGPSPWLTAAEARRERFLGDAGEAVRLAQQALALLEEAGDLRGCVSAQINLTCALERAGKPAAAQLSRHRAMTRASELGDDGLRATALHSYAIVSSAETAPAAPQLEYAEQVELLEEIVAIRQRLGDLRGIALALNNLAVLHGQAGQPLSALDALERSLAIRQRMGDRRGEAMNLLNLATLQNKLGEHTAALEGARSALETFQESSDSFGAGLSLSCCAHALVGAGRLQEAQHCFTQAAEINRASGYLPELGMVLLALARVRRDLGQPEDAALLTAEALPLLTEAGRRLEQAEALILLSTWYTDSGELELAREAAGRALDLQRHLDHGSQLQLHSLAAELGLVCALDARA